MTNQWYPDYVGGTARVVAGTAIGLAALGHQVTVLAPAIDGAPPEESIRGVRLLRVLKRYGLPQTYVDVVSAYLAARSLAREKWDVILGHDAGVSAGAHLALRDIPLIYVFHASAALEAVDRRHRGLSWSGFVRSVLTEPMMVVNEAVAVNAAARILTLSQFSESLVSARHPSASADIARVAGAADLGPVPNESRDVLRQRLGVDEGTRLLLTVRRLVARTGVNLLLDAFAHVAGGRTDIKLAIVGTGEELPKLQEQCRRLGIDAHTRFLGRLDDGELSSWYQAADLFVLPTVSYEGFGIATAEALASGTPVVATSVGATPEILTPEAPGWLAGAPTPSALSEALQLALSELTSDHRDRAREFAEARLTWTAVMPDWEATIAEALR